MSLYIPKMSDTPGITIPGLAGNFVQIESVFAKWERIDNLSAPMNVNTDHANRVPVPVKQPVKKDGIYAIEFFFETTDVSRRHIVITKSALPISTRVRIPLLFGNEVHAISYVGETSFAFYRTSGDYNKDLYVGAIYLVKEGL